MKGVSLTTEVAFSIISAGVEPTMATHTLLRRERRSWGAMLGTFNLIDAIAYLTEGAVRMQIIPAFFGEMVKTQGADRSSF